MLSQWDCFLKNLGEWHGSFTRFSATGVETEDTPSIVTLEGREDNRAVHQVVRYLPVGEPSRDIVVDYSYNNLNRSILFFEDGAFSQGSMQWGPYSVFGGEFGSIYGDRRLRMVQLYNSSSEIEKIVLIRERLPNSKTSDRPNLTVNDLLGEWKGEAVTMYPDLRNSDTFTTYLQIERQSSDRIQQKLSFGTRTISSSAKIVGSRLLFEESSLPAQILLLPDGASCNCPVKVESGHNFVLEMGWLLDSHKRQRIIRNYNDKGNWVSCTSVIETKVS